MTRKKKQRRRKRVVFYLDGSSYTKRTDIDYIEEVWKDLIKRGVVV